MFQFMKRKKEKPIGEFPLCKELLALTADGGRWGLPPSSVVVEPPPPPPPCVPLDPSARVT